MKNILVIGSINMDLRIETDCIPKIGETITGYGFSVSPGGKGANQAIAAARLGCNVKLMAAVGDDLYGDRLRDNLTNNQVDFDGVVIPNCSSGIAMITVCDGNNSIILDKGANNALTPALIDEKAELLDWADYVVLQLEIPVETVIHIIKVAKTHKTKVILNPAPFLELPEEIYRSVDFLIPNEHEAESMTGICLDTSETCIAAVNRLRDMGIKNVIITLGVRGCVYNEGERICFHPAVKVKAVDTTAAGDSFIGALCAKMSGEYELPEALAYAAKVSAITVSRYGASDSIPFAHELD